MKSEATLTQSRSALKRLDAEISRALSRLEHWESENGVTPAIDAAEKTIREGVEDLYRWQQANRISTNTPCNQLSVHPASWRKWVSTGQNPHPYAIWLRIHNTLKLLGLNRTRSPMDMSPTFAGIGQPRAYRQMCVHVRNAV